MCGSYCDMPGEQREFGDCVEFMMGCAEKERLWGKEGIKVGWVGTSVEQ